MILSIITITYNNPEELKATLSSVPDYEFIEQVIVNGGNPEDTSEIKKLPETIVINEKDNGISDAFNKGTAASSGEALLYLNSGDKIINPGYLIKALTTLKENKNISFVHSNILFVDKLGGELLVKPRMKNSGRGMKYLHPSMIIRKEVFAAVNGFDTDYKIAMDFDFVLKAENKGYKGFYIDGDPVVRMEGGGKSQQKEFSAIMECYKSLKANNRMTLRNAAGLTIRISLFYLRKLLVMSGGGQLLGRMKKIKYPARD